MSIGPGELADGFESISSGEGNDSVTATFTDPGTEWEMVIDSGAGDDVIVVSIEDTEGSKGSIEVRTGTGDDSVLIDSWAPVVIAAGSGSDTVICGWGSDGVSAGSGADVVRCRSGDDVVRGGEHKDTLRGGTGSDAMNGGPGIDLCFSSHRDSVTSCRRPS